ncbi:MAG TPA: hypothetical protein VFE50_21350 [Cyclobacteriaceae bacterium]|nr:hypothetical protein [Cyclobacteriaceae bacterium]
MKALKDFVNRFPIWAYFVGVFIISWGGVLVAVQSSDMRATPDDTARLFSTALVAMLAGPTVGGIQMTAVVFGRQGFRNLWSKFNTWRVGLQWYGVAVLIIPLLTGSILWILSQSWSSSGDESGGIARDLLFPPLVFYIGVLPLTWCLWHGCTIEQRA